jgi:NAD(P)-dependent dehydrogenase (short-subunit alcohol dehydrogenase family)
MELPTYTKQWHNDVYADIDASRPELSAKGKRVVITGGAGGIGGATAEAFAVAGAAEVVILGRTQKTLDTTKAAISSRHADVSVVAIVCDVADSDSVDKAFTAIASRGKIDIFVNNAGFYASGDVATQDANSWWSVYEINVKGSLLATQAAIKNINDQDGIIINVSSAASHVSFVPKYSAYSTSKIAFAKAVEYLHYEKENLKVFNVQPGIIESTTIASKATQETGLSFPQQDTGKSPKPSPVWLID